MEGISRFLVRVWRLCVKEDGTPAVTGGEPSLDLTRLLHRTVRKVTEDLDALKFNTAISQMMVFVNEVMKQPERPKALLEPFVLLLSPFAPHLGEELWQRLGHAKSLAYAPWPDYDPALCIEDTVTVAVQVNGKLRATLELPRGAEPAEVQAAALADERVSRYVNGGAIRKAIFVKDKLLNLVVSGG
jgi:leucyl-tRNA synthetase